jgi:hypothetical protein
MIQEAATTAASAGWEPRDYAAILSAVTAIVAVIIGYLTARHTLKIAKSNSDAAIWQKANELELKDIQARLDGFYGPFRHTSQVNMLMNRDLRSRQNDGGFILIEKLFDQAWRNNLSAGEQALLGEIAAKAKELREFIAAHLGMMDEKVLPYLARVSAHYRMIELAYDNELGTDPEPFVDRYVFPRQIDDVLRLEVERLERRRAVLMANPYEAPPPSEQLRLPPELALKEWPNPPRVARPELNLPVT